MNVIDDAAEYGWQDAAPEESHAYLLPAIEKALRPVALSASSRLRVFDAGCGNGALLRVLSGRGYELGGCDISEQGVAHARSSCPDAHIEHLSGYDPLAERFGTEWDVVISTEVIEHLYAPRTFARRVHELLRPGGTLIVSTPYHGYLKNLALAAAGALDSHFTALWDGGHIKFWSFKTLSALLAERGFENFRFSGAGRLPYLWKSMVVSCRKGAS